MHFLTIRTDLDARTMSSVLLPTDCYEGVVFSEFKSITTEELSSTISAAVVKTCELDPFPAPILKKCLDVLLLVNTKIVNLSLEQGVLPGSMKEASLRPLLKQTLLDHELFPNYRPIIM